MTYRGNVSHTAFDLGLVQDLLMLKMDGELKIKDDILPSFLAFPPRCNPLNTTSWCTQWCELSLEHQS